MQLGTRNLLTLHLWMWGTRSHKHFHFQEYILPLAPISTTRNLTNFLNDPRIHCLRNSTSWRITHYPPPLGGKDLGHVIKLTPIFQHLEVNASGYKSLIREWQPREKRRKKQTIQTNEQYNFFICGSGHSFHVKRMFIFNICKSHCLLSISSVLLYLLFSRSNK